MSAASYGLRMLLNAHQSFTKSGLPVYLRVKNFIEDMTDGSPETYIEVGMPYAPSGSDALDTGIVDILIEPQPAVQDISLHNLALFGTRLNFGSCIFYISHTWVDKQAQELNLHDHREVFRNRDGHKAVGLIHDGRLFSIESITHAEGFGEHVGWKIVGNAHEQEVAHDPNE